MFRASNFDKLLEKATSNLRLDPDWPTIIQICDLIRQNDCSPKYAVSAVKKKLYSQNPHQAMFGLLTLESIVKNCGSGVHDEVTSKAFCEMLRELVKTTQHENLRNKILELIQAWAFAFRNSPKYRAVQDTVNILKAEGYKFPSLKESDAMFSADTAPEWADGEVCHRCRVAFSLIVRRHHCRACGQVFCQLCSSKTSTLPKFGIEKEVRVCDACFDKVSRPPTSSAKLEVVDAANDYGPTQPKKSPGGKSAEELQEEEELQLALALSQSEAEQKEKERKSRAHIAPDPTPHHPTVSPSPSTVSASPEHSTQANTELSRYLDRNYWEQRRTRDNGAAAPTAPAPASHTSNDTNDDFSKVTNPKSQEDDAEDKEIDEFVETLKSQVEIFVNRMKSNSSRGRSIANDTAVQTLFMNITAMHSRLLKYIQLQDDKRVYLESLQDKVSQIKDSRAALDTLRAEHSARLAAAAEAAERQRQMQMAAKLQAMRKKKHEYLQYQRQLALQRVQEQEREMQMRQEQQKHQYMMSANSGYYMPGVSMNQFQPGGYPNQPIYGNPQFHPQMMPQSANDASLTMPGQPPISQPNMPLNPNQITSITQPMTHMTNTYAMSTSLPAVGQPPNSQPSMNQQNIRPQLAQQMSLQQQMMMQQMHQIRLSAQPGMHHMVPPQGVTNGPAAQQNGQNPQIPKQNLPNQPQHTNAIPPVTIGQQNMPQPMMNQNNQMLGMHMQNMRMPLVQGNPPNANNQQVPVSSYPMNMQNQNQSIPQVHNTQQQPQISLANQPMVMPGQMLQAQSLPSHHPQGLAIPNHIPQNNQSIPNQGTQVPQTQNQPMHPQGQHTQTVHGHPTGVTGQQGQQMMIHGQQLGPQGQNIPQIGQQMLNQGLQGPMQPGQQIQQMIPGQQMAPQMHSAPMPHQLPQAPQLQGQLPQQIVGQGQQIPVGQPQPNSGQPIKLQQPNFVNAPQDQQQHAASQAQQAQAPVKSEHNNNTAELISFD